MRDKYGNTPLDWTLTVLIWTGILIMVCLALTGGIGLMK